MALLHCISPYTAILLLLLLTYRLIFILMSTAYGVLHALVVGVCKGGWIAWFVFDVAGSFFQNYNLPIFILIPPPNV